jgi:DNA invertase Pin-like site-specific DNA recombinase
MELVTEQEKKPRVVLLYRASSKKQTDSENDIPLQRNILKPWAEQKGYEYIREFVEGGISGFKVSASKRDAIIEIKAMAERREFDILGIYMSDRLGRIAEETPLIVSFLNARGIRVISYTEGEIGGVDCNHSDKLLTYIRYWQAEGESLKTSMRCCDAVEECVKRGVWRGGKPPYGYKTVSRGTQNFKGKPILDVEIDPERAETVRLIFRLYTKEHYGSQLIAQYLNDHGIPTRGGESMWNAVQVCNMLRCRTYTGIFVLHSYIKNKPKIESPFMPFLKIIEQEDYDTAQRILKKNNRNPERTYMPTRHGKLLLTGMLYCGTCGEKITSHHCVPPTQRDLPPSERTVLYYYRCRGYTMKPKAKEFRCKPAMWSASQADNAVIRDAKRFIKTIDIAKLLSTHEADAKERLKTAEKSLSKIEADTAKKEREITKLNDEIMRALFGESSFSQDTLSKMLNQREAELKELTDGRAALQEQVNQVKQDLAIQKTVCQNFDGWEQRFDNSPIDEKRAMLLNIIDRIDAFGDRFEITFHVGLLPLSNISIAGTEFAETGASHAISRAKRYMPPTA